MHSILRKGCVESEKELPTEYLIYAHNVFSMKHAF